MKQFDFEKTGYCPERVKWLKENHTKKLTENEFVVSWMALRKFSRAKHKGSRNSPSNARHEYRMLVKKFGFFK